MQRILQPGDIESLDHTSFPRVLLPQLPGLFVERAARLRQLAEGNPIADYLQFVAQIVDAQAKAAGQLTLAEPDAALIARAQEHSMPLLPAADYIDPAWHGVLDRMLDALSGADGLPAPLQPLLQELRALDTRHMTPAAPEMLLAAEGDEVLDWREMSARYPHALQIIQEGGDHALSNFEEYLPQLDEFLNLA
ncbi:MAG TPA: hypothetical protein DDZ62_09320 [Delftia acidovorans]|nr:hypothetical protein [Delftia acidovorans]